MFEPDRYMGVARAYDRSPGFITDLVLRCGRGDEAALDRLFDLFYGLVLAVLKQQGPAEPEEELVIEAFVHLWRRAPTYNPGDQSPVEWVINQISELADLSSPVMAAS